MISRVQTRLHGRASLQRGFALVTGVFLITMLFLLSAFMIGFRVYQEASVSLDTLSTRAYAAARSGIEWGAYNSLINGNCVAGPTALALGGTLNGYTVAVTCAPIAFDEGGVIVNMDTIVATACNNAVCNQLTPAPNYVERQLSVMVNR